MSDHTLGPWTNGLSPSGEPIVFQRDDFEHPRSREWRANHRLMECATELLATVREFAAACAECHGTGQLLYRSSEGAVGDPCPGCGDLRALISRAS